MGMQLCLDRFTELIEKKKLEKAKKTDTSKRFNGVILKCVSSGVRILKMGGTKISKDTKNCRIFLYLYYIPLHFFLMYITTQNIFFYP